MTSNPEHPVNPTPSFDEEPSSTDVRFSLWHTFKHHIPQFVLTILFDVVLPLVLFLVLQHKIKSVYALLIAGIPPLFMILIKAIISRRFDALGFLVFIAFLISAIVALVTKNDIALLLEKSLLTGIISLIFGISLTPVCCCSKQQHPWRPIAYYLYQDLVPTKRHEVGLPDDIFDNVSESINEQHGSAVSVQKVSDKQEVSRVYNWMYTHCSSFRLSCYLITSIWSIGFFFECICRIILILVHLSVENIVIFGNVILGLITGLCIISTVVCVIRERQQTLALIRQYKKEHSNPQEEMLSRPAVSVWTVPGDLYENNFIYEMNNKIHSF
jgi:hypothetical protein